MYAGVGMSLGASNHEQHPSSSHTRIFPTAEGEMCGARVRRTWMMSIRMWMVNGSGVFRWFDSAIFWLGGARVEPDLHTVVRLLRVYCEMRVGLNVLDEVFTNAQDCQ